MPAGFDGDGFAVSRGVAPTPLVVRLARMLPPAPRAGVRNLTAISPVARELAGEPAVRSLAGAVLGPGAIVARAILFDKTPDANWAVPFHQDSTIAVRERIDVEGFGPWSIKEGLPHVQPPAHILERMVTIRIHVDPCDESNGPLVVLPGSHAHGLLNDADVARWKATARQVVCCADAGDAVVMRPLLLHASPRASNPSRRRVVHLEFAAGPLPGGLQWVGTPA
jgi:ectoine hydroxylase-related dioxygenase (phytanoyl-CoA dioxygenase family)